MADSSSTGRDHCVSSESLNQDSNSQPCHQKHPATIAGHSNSHQSMLPREGEHLPCDDTGTDQASVHHMHAPDNETVTVSMDVPKITHSETVVNPRHAEKKRVVSLSANKTGVFTTQEREQLFTLQKEHGNKWSKIGKIMGRSRTSVSTQFNWQPATVKGTWSKVENKTLLRIIKRETGVKDLNAVSCSIPWQEVASQIPNRNVKQCRLQWLKNQKENDLPDEPDSIAAIHQESAVTPLPRQRPPRGHGRKTGNYSTRESKRALKLQKRYRNNNFLWDKIGNIMDRTDASVCSHLRWKPAIVKGAWTKEEERILVRRIKRVTKEDDVSQFYCNIPWRWVAEGLANRNDKQCRRHWLQNICANPKEVVKVGRIYYPVKSETD
jgi:hypothetical protein